MLAERRERPEDLQLLALELGDRLALGERLGHRLAVELGELRLVVERLELRRPARHVQEDDALGSRPEVRGGRRSTEACWSRGSAGFAAGTCASSSEASAIEPSPIDGAAQEGPAVLQ